MDWRIFFSTFGLIFLAELGDKTQLTAFAISASSRSSMSVFLGSTLAFVISGGIAVILGTILKKEVPMGWIQLVAAILFLIFGSLTLWTAVRSLRQGPAAGQVSSLRLEPARQVGDLGALSRFALRAAVDFEQRAVDDYDRMRSLARSPEVSELFHWLSHADSLHHRIVSILEKGEAKGKTDAADTKVPTSELGVTGDVQRPLPTRSVLGVKDDIRLLEQAEHHELTAHLFYKELSQKFSKYEVASHFAQLAAEESLHLQKIRELKKTLTLRPGALT